MEKLKEGLANFIHMISALFAQKITSLKQKLDKKLKRKSTDSSPRESKTQIEIADTLAYEEFEPITDGQYKLRIAILKKQLEEAKNMCTIATKYRNPDLTKDAQEKEHLNWQHRCEIKEYKEKIKELENELAQVKRVHAAVLTAICDFIVENMKTEIDLDDSDSWVKAETIEHINELMRSLDEKVSAICNNMEKEI